MKYFIKTFGCQQNTADSERIARTLKDKGIKETEDCKKADIVVINTCMVRKSAENRAYGLINNLSKLSKKPKIILTGCLVGLAYKDKSGKIMKNLKNKLKAVDEFLAIEEVGFNIIPIRKNKKTALVPISNGCNNFCTYCVVPYTRGREVSRPYDEIIKEARKLKEQGYGEIILLGQNVNSYGADLIENSKSEIRNPKQVLNFKNSNLFRDSDLEIRIYKQKPVYVKHLGRYRIPTLFPYLLEEIAKMGFKQVNFISSNPWDFSDELIDVIYRNENITRTIHLPVQSGDNDVLKRMNRWYTSDEYINLVTKLKSNLACRQAGIPNLKLTTDIIVGFPGETEEEFENTVKLCKKINFDWAYIAMYSPRPQTIATLKMKDDVPHEVKKQRWLILENLINQPKLKRKKL